MPDVTTTLRIPNYASNPGSPLAGQMYINTVDKVLYYYTGTAWLALAAGGVGDVTGPSASSDNEIAVFNSTTGKIIKRSSTFSGLAKVASGVLSTITDNSANWDTAFTDRNKWDGGSTGLTASTGRTSLGANTVGSNIFTLANPGAISYPRIDAANAVTAASAATVKTDLAIGDAAVWENASTANQVISVATEVYVANSTITLPTAGTWTQGGQYRCVFHIDKTAGTGGFIVLVRFGTAGTTSDGTIVTFATMPAGTAVADTGKIEILLNFRAVGGSATVIGMLNAWKNNSGAAGLWGVASTSFVGTPVGGAFSLTTQTKLGVTFTGGTAYAGNIQLVQAEYKQ